MPYLPRCVTRIRPPASVACSSRSIGMLAEHLARQLREYLEVQMAAGMLRPVKVGLATYLITSTLISTIAGRRRDSRAASFSPEELAEMIAILYGEGLLKGEECLDTK